MNTRGIMELVVLNIGYDLGIISGELFTLLVLMGLISTLTSSPLIRILLVKKEKFVTDTNLKKQNLPSVLIAFGPPQSGSTLLLLSSSIFKKSCEYSAIHLSPVSEKITIENTGKNSKEIFKPITKLAEEKLVSLQTIYHHTNNITSEIVSLTNSKDYDYLIIGAAKTLFGDNILGGKVDTIVSQVKSRVGIFLDRGFKQISSLLIYYQNPIESDILFEIGGMIQKDGVQDINLVYEKGYEQSEEKLRKYFSKGIRATSTDKNSKKIMNRFSLILIGYSHWLEISSDQTDKFLSEKEEDVLNNIVQ